MLKLLEFAHCGLHSWSSSVSRSKGSGVKYTTLKINYTQPVFALMQYCKYMQTNPFRQNYTSLIIHSACNSAREQMHRVYNRIEIAHFKHLTSITPITRARNSYLHCNFAVIVNNHRITDPENMTQNAIADVWREKCFRSSTNWQCHAPIVVTSCAVSCTASIGWQPILQLWL